jgi:hypothetical protein
MREESERRERGLRPQTARERSKGRVNALTLFEYHSNRLCISFAPPPPPLSPSVRFLLEMLRLLPLALLAFTGTAATTREQITFAPLLAPSRLSSCPADPPPSCPAPPEGSDSCCVSTGQFLL